MNVNPKWLIGGIALVLYQATIGGGFGNIQAQMAQGQVTRQQRQNDGAETQARQIAMDKLAQQAPIADARYAANCQIVVSSLNTGDSMAIVIGAPVLVGASNVPLSVGNLVCDANGFTAEIVPGVHQGKPAPVAGLEARTMDQQVIAAAVKRYQQHGINIKQNSQ
jgi:hypothetical protein